MSDTIYTLPGQSFFSELENAPTGLVGTIGVRVLAKLDGAEAIARTTAGIVEQPAGSGRYVFHGNAPTERGAYGVFWDLGEVTPGTTASDDLNVVSTLPSEATGPPAGAYVGPDELREALEVDEATLSDVKARQLISFATTLVEAELGGLPRHTTGPQEGLMVAEDQVAPYQWEALRAAVLAIARHLYSNPDLLNGARLDEIKGPDFSYSGATGKLWGDEAGAFLRASGLAVTGARARP